MKKSTVKSVSRSGEFDSHHGKLYNYNYVLEDGATGQMAHKNDEARFPVGTEVEYETYMKGEFSKIKLQKPGSDQGGGNSFKGKSDPNIQVMIVRQNCVGNALKYFELKKDTELTKEKVVQMAEYLKQYVENGLTGSAVVAKKTESKPYTDAEINELNQIPE